MAEVVKTQEHYYTKDFSGYNNKEDNFVANQELTVSITLNEYRRLVGNDASTKARIDKAEKDQYTRNSENEKLAKEVQALKIELYELKQEKIDRDTAQIPNPIPAPSRFD